MADAGTPLAGCVRARLAAQSDPQRAVSEKAYLHSELSFLGVSVPAIRRTVRSCATADPVPRLGELRSAVAELWDDDVHEHRMAAVELLVLRVGELTAEDAALVERLIRGSGTWALVDGLAASVMGPLVDRRPELGTVLDTWAASEDFWLRRSALLAHLLALRGGGGDWDRFTRYAEAMLDETEFFVRKAIGWVLRDTGRRRPALVVEWILPRAARASGVTLREAVKPLSPGERDAVLAAAGRPGSRRRAQP